ncbi:hypothetical protein FACS1894217_09790 [Clostridia bacterium]|nr:hypothetical protein FACS1894217_09790 [Clostridia bacterium]
MDFKTCRTCGKIFSYKGSYVCPDCVKEEDKKFTLVRNYMFDNPVATMADISEACDVDEEIITRWLREGRLVARDSAPLLKCAKCGKSIMGGMYCQSCSDKFSTQIGGVAREMQRSIDKANERSLGPLGVGARDTRK